MLQVGTVEERLHHKGTPTVGALSEGHKERPQPTVGALGENGINLLLSYEAKGCTGWYAAEVFQDFYRAGRR